MEDLKKSIAEVQESRWWKRHLKVNQALLGDICGVIASALKDSISNVIF